MGVEVRQLRQQLRLDDQVLILGERSDIPQLLDASDVFVLASYAEGMPLSICEALAKGVPVIASAVDGISEQIDETCGVLIPSPGSDERACVRALAETLDRFNCDRSPLQSMSAAAVAQAHRNFSPARMIDSYGRLLTDIAGERKHGGSVNADTSLVERLDELELDFAQPSLVWRYLGEGWSFSEPDGVWTDGNFSSIEFSIEWGYRHLRLIFEVRPFIASSCTRQRTDVSVNGRFATSWFFDKSNVQQVVVDVKNVEEGRPIVLRFEHRNARSPADLGLGDDARRLSLFFSRMEASDRPRRLKRLLGRFLPEWRAS